MRSGHRRVVLVVLFGFVLGIVFFQFQPKSGVEVKEVSAKAFDGQISFPAKDSEWEQKFEIYVVNQRDGYSTKGHLSAFPIKESVEKSYGQVLYNPPFGREVKSYFVDTNGKLIVTTERDNLDFLILILGFVILGLLGSSILFINWPRIFGR